MALPGFAAPANGNRLAATPPMGWNDWAHYMCGYTSQDILANARVLVKSGLAAQGYNTVTIDDCWMQKDRDASGNLQPDPQRFPQGIKPIAQAIHALGLKFGIYEDAGYATCGGWAGSGEPKGGGKDHFLQDARLFASWGVDYLKLDGCNVYVPAGGSTAAAYRKAYAAENAALKAVGRPIVFSESAPAYFQGTPDWYDVLSWVRDYGQLWREGTDIATFNTKKPDNPRFHSVRLELRLQSSAGPVPEARAIGMMPISSSAAMMGLSLAETRSQLTLWSMMSAPLILSSDLARLSPQSIKILSNKAVIAVDQDALGKMATLVRRSATVDVLFKQLSNGDDAIAVLNRGHFIRPSRSASCRFRLSGECRMPPGCPESLERNACNHFAGRGCQSRYRHLARPSGRFLRHADTYRHHHHGGRLEKIARLSPTIVVVWLLREASEIVRALQRKPGPSPTTAR